MVAITGGEPRERKRELLIYWLYRAAERVINALPRWLVLPAAAAVGNVAYDLAGPKGRLTRENLARPMRLPADDARVAAAARRAFRNYAKYLVDMMRIGELTSEVTARIVRIENPEMLDEVRQSGHGVISCTVHVGGMDFIGPALKLINEAMHVVADDTTYGRLYEHMKAARERQHIFLIGWRNLRGLFRALRANKNLVLFCDGGYRRGDVPVEFCGEATTFPLGPASLAARTGAPLMPVACRRIRGDRFLARGLPLIHCEGDDPSSIHRATQAVADALGGVIREDPGQWYMFRPVWPQTDADRAYAIAALAAARRGDDWTKTSA
ncbi:MAG: lysophospholipid acyltransferase family protein [Chloroflexi bacterium]|nr:lysophospholipid acyltransferase family protein [Chloroflexota bacterium]